MMMWTAGVVLLTFDKDKSPGSGLGNLYFFTWGGWSIYIFLFTESFQKLLSRDEVSVTDKNEGDNAEEKDKPAMEQINEEEQVTTDNEGIDV